MLVPAPAAVLLSVIAVEYSRNADMSANTATQRTGIAHLPLTMAGCPTGYLAIDIDCPGLSFLTCGKVIFKKGLGA